MRFSFGWLLTLTTFMFAYACGDDTNAPEDSNIGTAAQGGSDDSGSGGTGGGGSGDTGGSGGSSATGGPGANPTPQCGDTTCTSAGNTMGFMTACCAEQATSTCGISVMGRPCTVPAEPDPRCPSVEVGAGIVMLVSCCTDQGQCGIDATAFGAGCVELAEAAAGAMMQGGGGMITFPEPRACDAVDDDAGL